uniref:Uncharacterized protein n=1 Tax=Glossina palpalis gambiensis TaxID=67801 RepID=A0A1B0AQK1_9MUSC
MGIKCQGPDCLQWDQSVVFLICAFKRSHLHSRTENELHELNSCHLTCSIAKIRANTVTISRQAATAIAVIKPSGQLFKHLPSWAKRPERHVMHCDSAEPLQVAQDE